MTTGTRSKYAVEGKCFYCDSNCKGFYCDEECQDMAMKLGRSCLLCEALTKEGEVFCSQECEDAHKKDCRVKCYWSKECTL